MKSKQALPAYAFPFVFETAEARRLLASWTGTAGDDDYLLVLSSGTYTVVDVATGLTLTSSSDSFWTIDMGGGNDFIEAANLPSSATTLLEGLGNDTVIVSASIDSLSGGSGNDLFRPSGGNDIVSGGDGTDLYDASNYPSTLLLNWSLDGVANDTITGTIGGSPIGSTTQNIVSVEQ